MSVFASTTVYLSGPFWYTCATSSRPESGSTAPPPFSFNLILLGMALVYLLYDLDLLLLDSSTGSREFGCVTFKTIRFYSFESQLNFCKSNYHIMLNIFIQQIFN